MLNPHDPTDEEVKAEHQRRTAKEHANTLRRMADWIESHPDAAVRLMSASIASHSSPRICLFSSEPLRSAYRGRSAVVEKHGDCRVVKLIHEGIEIEGWDTQKEPKVTEEVTL